MVSGLDSEKKYTVYFAIQDSDRNLIGEELQVAVSDSDTVTFVLTPEIAVLMVFFLLSSKFISTKRTLSLRVRFHYLRQFCCNFCIHNT